MVQIPAHQACSRLFTVNTVNSVLACL